MHGINKYEGKDKRRQRMRLAALKVRNPVAKDLGSTKYKQQVIPARKTQGHDYRHDVYGPYPESDDF